MYSRRGCVLLLYKFYQSDESNAGVFHSEGTLYVTITSKLLVSEVMKKLRGSDPIYEVRCIGRGHVASAVVHIPKSTSSLELDTIRVDGDMDTEISNAEEKAAASLLAHLKKERKVVVVDDNYMECAYYRKDCRKLRRFISKVVEKLDSAMHACSAFKRGWQITLDYMTSTEDTCNQICNSYFGLNNGNNVSGTAASILLDVFHLGEWIGETTFAGTADLQDTTERML